MRLGKLTLLLTPFMAIGLLHWLGMVQSMTLRPAGGVPLTRRALLESRRLAKQLAAQQAVQPQPPKPVVVPDASAAVAAATVAASTAAPTAASVAMAQLPPDNATRAEAAFIAKRSSDTCPGRKAYHTILTATAQVYQQWQCRVMYFHWKKQRDNDPKGACTELTGFTRLVASAGGRPDGLEGEVPSYFVKEYTGQEAAKFHGYRVVNRPYSVVQFLTTQAWRDIAEDYVYIAETDHVLMHPLPNKATRGSPMAYRFQYMGPNPAHARVIETVWPAGGKQGYTQVQPIGPSPVVIHKADLELVAEPWNTMSVKLKTNAEADRLLGWVIEMWGYSVAAASVGLRHQVFADFQVEPGGNSGGHQLENFDSKYWVFHYTYQFEYMLDGTPCRPWTIGEFSLDKRHFTDQYPTPPLPQPPAKANVAAFWLLDAFNEAMAAIPNWPRRQPAPPARATQTLYGRRRLDWFSRHDNGFSTELRTMPLVKALAGSDWTCDSAWSRVRLGERGDATVTPGGTGRWGTMNDPTLGEACPTYHCLFVDVRGQYNVGVGAAGDTLTVYGHADMSRRIALCRKAG